MSTTPWNTLVVDDERLARVELIDLLRVYPHVDVLAEAASLDEAQQHLQQTDFALVFLDIQLGTESGFDVLTAVPETCRVVFVTAYDAYAVRAFEVNAVDYLLKPVHPDRLAETMRRLDKAEVAPSEQTTTETPPARSFALDERLFVEIGGRWQFLRIDAIRCIEAAGDYTLLHTTEGRQFLVHKSMHEWAEGLPAHHFARIHRSTIINLEQVKRIEPWSNRTFRVFLHGLPEPFTMSRRYATALKQHR